MKRPPLYLDRIPAELRDLPRWVLWRYEQRGDKATKVPVQPSGRMASSTDPATWSRFDTILEAAGRHGTHGIGIVLNGDGLAGVDFDDCIGDDGTINEDVRCWIDRFGTYAERSPSGPPRGRPAPGRPTMPRSIAKLTMASTFSTPWV